MSEPAARPLLIGIDPGQSKCGYAAVYEDGTRLAVEVVPTALLAERIERDVRGQAVKVICVGDATTSEEIRRLCEARWPSIGVTLVDETNTTLEARRLYYDDNPPKGIMRFVPRGLLVPKEPLDGYAALLILKRYRLAVEGKTYMLGKSATGSS